MEHEKEFLVEVGSIIMKAIGNSGADMSLVYADDKQQKPDPQIFNNISGQYAEMVIKAKKRRKK